MIRGKRKEREAIDGILDDLRSRYKTLAESGKLSGSALQAFDDRYYAALRERTDLQRFLRAEAGALEELEVRSRPAESPGPAEPEEEEESFIDRVARELYERIEHYPSGRLPAGASFDMEKLAGMLMQFGRDHWPAVERAARSGRMSLEAGVIEHCIPDSSGLPAFFSRYVRAVGGGREREYEHEEKRCLAGAAAFLHGMKKDIYTLMSRGGEDENTSSLKEAEVYILTALDNFRMKNLILF